MTKFSVLAVCATALLAACSPAPKGPLVGPDGRPLPQVYKMTKADIAEIPFRVVDSVNTLRAAKGVQQVQLNDQLNAASVEHSRNMSSQNRPWHFGSDGSSPLLRAQRAGYAGHLQGELVAETYQSELEVLADWSGQTDTRAVLMDPSANQLGIGWYQEPNGKLWWTLMTGDATRGPVANVSATALGRTVTSEMDHLGTGAPTQ